MEDESSSSNSAGPQVIEGHRVKAIRAHLRFLRHEVRTPINAIIGYGEMLQDECPPALLGVIIGDLGTLLATARRMTHVVAETLNHVDTQPDLERVDRFAISRLLGEALTPILADCIAACERIGERTAGVNDGGEFAADLYKVHAALQQLARFLVNEPHATARPYDTPAGGIQQVALDPSGAFALARTLDGEGVQARSRDLEPSRSTILVVDDHAGNRALLHRRLTQHGYQVVEVEDAMAALQRLGEGGIDLILLDVLLPGMDGLTLCRTIKADPATAAIPVLLVTALHERQDRLAGIAAGANDFLTKPLDSQDLLLRCRNALAGKRQFDRTVAAYRKLQELEELRDRLTHLIVHDMRSPLAGLTGYLELFLNRSLGQVDDKLRQLVDRAAIQARSLEGLINHVLDVSRLEAGAMPLTLTEGDLRVIVGSAIEALGADAQRVPVRILPATGDFPLLCDQGLIRRVLINLFSNAIRFTPDGGEVVVRLAQTGAGLRVEVIDNGPGIALEHHALIFEKFGQVANQRRSGHATSGLGLTFCKLAIEAHQGRIGVSSQLGQGSLFWFILPGQ